MFAALRKVSSQPHHTASPRPRPCNVYQVPWSCIRVGETKPNPFTWPFAKFLPRFPPRHFYKCVSQSDEHVSLASASTNQKRRLNSSSVLIFTLYFEEEIRICRHPIILRYSLMPHWPWTKLYQLAYREIFLTNEFHLWLEHSLLTG